MENPIGEKLDELKKWAHDAYSCKPFDVETVFTKNEVDIIINLIKNNAADSEMKIIISSWFKEK